MRTLIIYQKNRNDLREATRCILVFSMIMLILMVTNTKVAYPAFNFLVLFGTGYLTWTFVEYFMHRFWMHNNLKSINSLTYQTHMNHHKHPTDIKISNLHRTVFILTGLVLFAIAVYFNNYFTCFVGFYFGFVFYTIIHVILHHRFGKYILPKVQIAHIHHHGKYPDTGYSFSTILWDYMFGTMAPKDAEITEQMEKFYFKKD